MSIQAITEPVYLFHRSFGDFDEFCESVVKWDLDYRQIERGRFNSELLMTGSAKIQLLHARLGRRLIQKGAPPAKMRTFGLLADSNIHIYWRGRNIGGDDLFVFPAGGELNSVTQKDFDAFAISLTEETLADACRLLEIPDFDRLLNGREVFRAASGDMQRLRRFLLSFSGRLSQDPGSVDSESLGRIADELSGLLLHLLSRSQGLDHPGRIARRAQVLRRVETFIADRLAEPPRLRELCQVANVSERTLDYAFREHYGVTPKAFINCYRLNAARKALLRADPRTHKVFEVAQSLGFWHMSQFAAAYRAMFEELPSATLRRPAA